MTATAGDRLAAQIAAAFSDFDDATAIAALCGTAAPEELAVRLEQWVTTHLRATVVRPRFFTLSVGPVAALELDDRRVVVVKGYQPHVRREALVAARRVQHHLARRAFPCAVPVAGPHPFGVSIATADGWLDDGGNDFGPGAMAASAEGLARMVALGAEVRGVDALSEGAMTRTPGVRYPRPHSPVFDFDRPDPRVSVIDALADRALETLRRVEAPDVTVHGDWSARNVRFGPEGLRGVYDWDSLVRMPEAFGVGIAAATWRSFGTADDAMAPGPDEIDEYRTHYERARGTRFTGAERAGVGAQALYALCYTARCEIGLGSGHPVRALGRLEVSGDSFLRDA